MEFVKFDQSNFTFTAPKDMPNCGDLPVFFGERDGQLAIISKWKLSEQDLENIRANDGHIFLEIVGRGMPPVSLYTDDPFVESNEKEA